MNATCFATYKIASTGYKLTKRNKTSEKEEKEGQTNVS